MKFTPGPWKITDRRPNDVLTQEEAFAIAGTTGLRWDVAAVWKDAGDEPEAEANARLIAAAPDLYEALERVVGACAGYLEGQVPSESDMYNPEYVGPLEQARAALARVEG